MDTAIPATLTGQTMRTIPVWQMMAEDLKKYGVETAFGLMSDDTMGIVVGLDGQGVAFHGTRHENHAVMAANGYSQATQKLGVVVIGRGPAMANAMNGTVSSSRSDNKVLVITGSPPLPNGELNHLGPDLKGWNAVDVLTVAGIKCFMPTSAGVARQTLADAVNAAEMGLTVVLHLPGNIQDAQVTIPAEESTGFIKPFVPKKPAASREPGIEAAVAMLAKAKRPLIIAGHGAHLSGAREALDALAEKTGAVCVTSVKGKDMFRDSPWNLNVLGSSAHMLGRKYAQQADVVIAFGAALNFLTLSAGMAVPKVPLIHVDNRRTRVGAYWFADVGIVGDAREVAEQLVAALPDRAAADKPFHSDASRAEIAAYDQADDFVPAHTPRTIDPRTLSIELDKLLPRERNVVWDAGNFFLGVQYISVPNPGHFKTTADFGSMGLGMGTGIGFAKGRSEVPTLIAVGDGGLLMSFGELETAVREDIPVIVACYNDAAYGAEVHILRMRELPVAKAHFPDIDFAPIAEGFGYEAYTIRSVADLHAIKDVLANPQGPIFLDCKVNVAVPNPVMAEFVELEKGKH